MAFDELGTGAFGRPRRKAPPHDSTILYVGSSLKDVRSRLKQHLRSVHKGTFALNLNRWIGNISDDHKANAAITVTVWAVSDPSDLGLIQDLEDLLWSYYKPLFGRRGRK